MSCSFRALGTDRYNQPLCELCLLPMSPIFDTSGEIVAWQCENCRNKYYLDGKVSID